MWGFVFHFPSDNENEKKENKRSNGVTCKITDSISNADNLYPPTFMISAFIPESSHKGECQIT